MEAEGAVLSRIDAEEPLIIVDQVNFERDSRRILDGICLRVMPGERWALIGPNGAGKTTLLNLCGAVLHPTGGTVRLLGHQLGRVDMRELRSLIGFVNPRHPLRSNLTATEVILTGATGTIELVPRWVPSADEQARAMSLMRTLGLSDNPGAEMSWLNMSQGERGRTLIARALMPHPPLLLLDEPTTGLDVTAREKFISSLDSIDSVSLNIGVVMVTHHFEELPRSITHAALLTAGTIVSAGPVHDVLTSASVSECFSFPIDLNFSNGRWSAHARTIAPPSQDRS